MTYLYVDKEYNTREEAEEKALESMDEFDITHFLLNGGLTLSDVVSAFMDSNGSSKDFYDWMGRQVQEATEDFLNEWIVEAED